MKKLFISLLITPILAFSDTVTPVGLTPAQQDVTLICTGYGAIISSAATFRDMGMTPQQAYGQLKHMPQTYKSYGLRDHKKIQVKKWINDVYFGKLSHYSGDVLRAMSGKDFYYQCVEAGFAKVNVRSRKMKPLR